MSYAVGGPEGWSRDQKVIRSYPESLDSNSAFCVLQPREKIQVDRDVSYIPELKDPGKIRLRLFYVNRNSGERYGYDAWTGTIGSNSVVIDVVSGTSD